MSRAQLRSSIVKSLQEKAAVPEAELLGYLARETIKQLTKNETQLGSKQAPLVHSMLA